MARFLLPLDDSPKLRSNFNYKSFVACVFYHEENLFPSDKLVLSRGMPFCRIVNTFFNPSLRNANLSSKIQVTEGILFFCFYQNSFGILRALSSMVEQFPFKEAVLGSSPRGLTRHLISLIGLIV